jgi:hypothetical protein
MTDRTHDGRAFQLLTIMDECSREALAIVVARQITADEVRATLTDLFITRGCPAYLRPDNGPEFCAKSVRAWLHWLAIRTLFIEPGSPWENSYNESFNGKLRDELLDREIFYTLREAQVLIEWWRQHTTPCDRIVPWVIGPRCPQLGRSLRWPRCRSRHWRSDRFDLTLRVDQSMGASHRRSQWYPVNNYLLTYRYAMVYGFIM